MENPIKMDDLGDPIFGKKPYGSPFFKTSHGTSSWSFLIIPSVTLISRGMEEDDDDDDSIIQTINHDDAPCVQYIHYYSRKEHFHPNASTSNLLG